MSSTESSEQPKAREHNPRWKGYVYILFSSLVSFASIADAQVGDRDVGIAFGVLTCTLSLVILALDRFAGINFGKALDGKLEGFMLLFFVLWWIAGVGYLTRSGGLAYLTSNIYFSSWIALGCCIYTLDRWSASKDIITMRQLTALSTTLSSWYVLFLSSLVVFASSVDLHLNLRHRGRRSLDTSSFSIALGTLSSCVAFFFILVHYKFFDSIKQGGWLELAAAFLMIVGWLVGVPVFTQHNGIASSLHGECPLFDTNKEDSLLVPGSNMFFFCWFCLISSINIPLRWKVAQVMQFAHASSLPASSQKEVEESGDDVDDDDI